MTTMGIDKNIRKVAVILTLLTFMSTGAASATIVKNLEFNTDGVLPSADPDYVFLASTGVVETDIFSVSGGTLTGNYPGGGSFPITYAYPNGTHGYPVDGGISPADPWMVEIRARVAVNRGGTFMLWNGNRRFSISFIDTGVRVTRSSPVTYLDYPCDITQWHVLRMWSNDGNYFSASVDGVEFATNQVGINEANITNGFFVRLNPHSEAAKVEWDYVRFEAGENAVAVENASFGGVKALFR